MVGSVQEIAGKLYAMGDWLRVESVTVECGGETTVIDEPLGEDVELPCPERPFSLTIRFEQSLLDSRGR